ncbi:MAG TPA: DUF6064 family protein [Candidatus Binatia bacterium]|jgi:hypothetical protein
MPLPLNVGRDEFLGVFTAYNQALWPAPEILSLIAFGTVCLALFPGPRRDRVAAALMSLLWAWSGLIYSSGFLSRITPLGYLFGGIFALQAAFLLHFGVLRHDVRFWAHNGPRHLAGIMLIFYALVAYPSLAALLGHAHPTSPSFGVPTPVTIFTFGMLLLTRAPYARVLFVVPLFWTIIGTWLAFELRIREDIGLIVAAALVLTMTPTEDDPDSIQTVQ